MRLDAGIGIASTTADLGDVIESGARVKAAREPESHPGVPLRTPLPRQFGPRRLPSPLSTAIVALWVQAIWMTSAELHLIWLGARRMEIVFVDSSTTRSERITTMW